MGNCFYTISHQREQYKYLTLMRIKFRFLIYSLFVLIFFFWGAELKTKKSIVVIR